MAVPVDAFVADLVDAFLLEVVDAFLVEAGTVAPVKMDLAVEAP